jgi:hypothetical protein
VAGQKLFFDLTDARTLSSARSAEASLRQALELAKGAACDVDIRRSARTGCLRGRAVFAGGYATVEAWPAAGYVAVDVTCDRGIRAELLLSALMDAFVAREGQIKRARSASDGARYKKPRAVASQAAFAKPARAVAERSRARRAA